jgi:hypothetical protein
LGLKTDRGQGDVRWISTDDESWVGQG